MQDASAEEAMSGQGRAEGKCQESLLFINHCTRQSWLKAQPIRSGRVDRDTEISLTVENASFQVSP